MSRVGKKMIPIPQGVNIAQSGKTVTVSGPKGELTVLLPRADIAVVLKNKNTEAHIVPPDTSDSKISAFWGLSRALIASAVSGVHSGFSKSLEIEGVGYRAEMKGENIVLHLGFSHDIVFTPPKGITITVEKNIIKVSGTDKYLVGEVSASIRRYRKPEPYKGKGIHYVGEHIRRKEGKKAAATA